MSSRSLRLLVPAVTSALLLSCASTSKNAPAGGAQDILQRAVVAQAGTKGLAMLHTVTIRASARLWEPEQSVKAGGEPRLLGDATFVVSRDLDSGKAKTEWTKTYVYPGPRTNKFTETVTASAGWVQGIDSTTRTKADLESVPPQHAMSGVRLVAAQRELARSSPRLLADMWLARASLRQVPDTVVGGTAYPTLSYDRAGHTFLVLFDPVSRLPARVRTLDADNVHGDSTYDLVLEDWQEVLGVRYPFAQRYELNGVTVARIRVEQVEPNPTFAPTFFDIPANVLVAAPKPATGPVPFQWVLRRLFLGIYLDTDAVSYDPAAVPGLKLVELAPGIAQVQGGTHTSLVVELPDQLVVVDAPVWEWQSRWTIDAATAKYPGKPIRTLVLTHHHMDHVGGARAYVAEGATVIVGAGNGEHFRKAFAAPDRVAGGALDRTPRRAEVVEVADRMTLGSGARTVELVRVDNPHCEGMLIAYVPDAKLGFVADLWSPGRDVLGDKLNPGQAALVAAVKKAGIAPGRFAGGHGTVADWAPLEALAAK